MKSVVLALSVLASSISYGQYVSANGFFQVDEKRGCAPFTVTITNANLITVGECTPGNPCDMSWGDGTPLIQNSFVHTYTTPGTYTLTIQYGGVGDQIQITVTNNTPPVFEMFTCNGNAVHVRVTDTSYDAYIINYNDASPEVQVPKGSLAVNNHTFISSGAKTVSVRGKDVNADDNCISNTQPVTALPALPTPFIDELEVISATEIIQQFSTAGQVQYRLDIATNNNTTFQLAQSFTNSTTATVSGLRTEDNYYCFRLGAVDVCNSNVTYSNINCSLNADLILQSDLNTMSWITHSAGITNFSVNRDGALAGTTVTSPFLDNAIICGTAYCYQVTANYANGSTSLSLPKCGEAFSTATPSATENITAIVTPSGVDLTWQQDPLFTALEYSIFRKQSNGIYLLQDTEVLPAFTDDGYTTAGEYCYRVNYLDACNNPSATGTEACPIRLSASLADDNTTTLSWSDYAGWRNGVNRYFVDKLDDQGALIQTTDNGLSTSWVDAVNDPSVQVNRYVIRAQANDGGLGQTVSNELRVVKEPKLYYPTAFTPDRQGPAENEIFKVFGQYIQEFELRIFNRWGELLFVSTNLDTGWDGTYKGKDQPEGTYAFIATLRDLAGRDFSRSGSVVLLRKQ
jgi:gliding motility-associated-like protein